MVSGRKLALIGGSAAAAVGIGLAARRVLAVPPPPSYEYVLVGSHTSSFTLDPLSSVGTVLEHQSEPTGGWEWVRLRSERPIFEVKKAWQACSDAWRPQQVVVRVAGPWVQLDLRSALVSRMIGWLSYDHAFQRKPGFWENMFLLGPHMTLAVPQEIQVDTSGQLVWSVEMPRVPTVKVAVQSDLKFPGTYGTVRRKLVVYDGGTDSYALEAGGVGGNYSTFVQSVSFPSPRKLYRAELYDNGSDYYPWLTRNNFVMLDFDLGPEFLTWLLDRIMELLSSILQYVVPPPEYQVQVDTNPGVFLSL